MNKPDEKTEYVKKPTNEELGKAMEEIVKQSIENFGYADSFSLPVHPLAHRNMLITQGYSKEKANGIIIKMAKKQGFLKEDLESLKENLEK